MFATMDVLRKAVENNCNFIIAHEPLYYNHLDNTENFKMIQCIWKKRNSLTMINL